MDPALRALCMEVLYGDVDGEKFALMLTLTGINVESLEWEIANRLLGEGEAISSLTRKFGDTVH